MLHPDVKLRKSSIGGKGLFAKKRMPKGTVLWRLEGSRIYTKEQYKNFSKRFRAVLMHFAYEDENGNLVYCTDNAKYWNHSCSPNSAELKPGSNMDVAIRDIEAGEELTYDYAFLMKEFEKPFKCNCRSKNCRGMIKRESYNSKIIRKLCAAARLALKNLANVKQPLLNKREIKDLLRQKTTSLFSAV